MKTFALSTAVFAALNLVSAHMEMSWPPPLRSKSNPFTTDIDYDMPSPLSADGSNYPCKGYLDLLGTDAASPIVTWQAGESYNMTIEGGASHNGGSCQASLSFDGGETFTVIKSFIGGCPATGSSSWDFTLPADTPSADDAIFAWTWFNQVGNREMYMNCAVVSTQGGANAKRQSSTGFSSRPEIFIANVGNGCSTIEGSDVEFPNPGPDVSVQDTQTSPPSGSCGSTSGDSPSDDGASSDTAAPTQTSSDTAAPTQTSSDTATPTQTSSTIPGGVFVPWPTTTMATVIIPSRTVETSVATATLGTGSDVAQAPWSPCENAGQYNCVGGTQFQRCAAGTWSPLTPTAPGTTCEPGVSDTLNIV